MKVARHVLGEKVNVDYDGQLATGGDGGDGIIPEFSTIEIILSLLVITAGFFLIKRRN